MRTATTRITNNASAIAYLESIDEADVVVEHNGAPCVARHCSRCGGSGYWSRGHWVKNGVCFKCDGSGGHTWIPVVRYARSRKASKTSAAREVAKREARLDAQRDENEAASHGRLTDREVEKAQFETRRAEREARWTAERAASSFVGETGKRSTFVVTVKTTINIDSHFGTKTLYIMRDESGNAIKWFCSGATLRREDGTWVGKNETATIVGTVKAHDTYNGEKQTTLSRVKLVEAVAA